MWLEEKYILMLSNVLPQLVNKGHGKWNYRCIFCGDSAKSKSKARGYLLRNGASYSSYCHNCHETLSFKAFIERLSPHLYDQYAAELLLEKREKYVEVPKKPIEVETDELLRCARISLLDDDHPAKTFLRNRLIPRKFFSKLYFTENFNEYANSFIPDKYSLDFKEQRIIIPMLNRSRKLIGFQGRSLEQGKDNLRYITVMLSPDNPRLFGLERVDFNQTNYIFEGPFDSLFIENSMATCGGQIHKELGKADLPLAKTVVVYDNEPRNPDIVSLMKKTINRNMSVVIWPKKLTGCGSDVNEMIEGLVGIGKDPKEAREYITSVLKENTFSGEAASIEFMEWKK